MGFRIYLYNLRKMMEGLWWARRLLYYPRDKYEMDEIISRGNGPKYIKPRMKLFRFLKGDEGQEDCYIAIKKKPLSIGFYINGYILRFVLYVK